MPTKNGEQGVLANDADEAEGADEADEGDKRGGDEPDSRSEEATGKPKSLRLQVRSAVVTMVMAVVQTSLIAWFGFTLSGRLELAIKERKATVEGAKAMGDLIVKLREEQTPDMDRSLMLQLAMYGEDAIGPMVIMAMTPGPYSPDIPIFGLQRLGITHRDSTCKALVAVRASNGWINDTARGPMLDNLFKEMQC